MKTLITEKKNSNLLLDPSDPTDAQLSRCAGRVSQLLTVPAVATTVDIQSSLDDFLGAVYALIRAKQKKFRNRANRNIDMKPVAQRAARASRPVTLRRMACGSAGFISTTPCSGQQPSITVC
jgi:hypothetical protein